MIDIHSHLKTDSGEGSVQKLLRDMDRFHINRRVISDMRYDDVQDGNQKIAELVKEYRAFDWMCSAESCTIYDSRGHKTCLLAERNPYDRI